MPGSTAYGCQRYDIRFSGSIRSIAISMVTCPWPGSVIRPWTRPPGAKAPSSFMPNQAPNSSALASARQTRDWGARRTISFSMRSVALCNFMVASYSGDSANATNELHIHRNALLAGYAWGHRDEYERPRHGVPPFVPGRLSRARRDPGRCGATGSSFNLTEMNLGARPLAPFVDPLRVPPRRVINRPARLTVRLETATHRFHRDMPPSRVWAYDGHLPGPTIEVERGTPVEVQWENHLSGRLPVIATRSSTHAVDGIPVQCMPGRGDSVPDPSAAAISGYAVVHLHGAVTQATSDGWTENLMAPGQQTLDTYPNDQRAALLWYHDHVMGITRYDLNAGLAGLWIIRDGRERELELPEGPPYELPLVLADRNFDTAPDGRLNGVLLHKIDPDVMECFSPFTVVNGVIWPRVEVEPTTYRFRVLNGSNARTYRLVLTHQGRPNNERITQIGTDGGLLAAPVQLPRQGLVLASAERADILVDFSDLDVGTELTLFNNAAAPFDGAFADPSTAGKANLEGLLPYPEVLGFHVIDGRRGSRRPPAVLATDFSG